MSLKNEDEAIQQAIDKRIRAGNEEAIKVLKELYYWKPEGGFPDCKPQYSEDHFDYLDDCPFFSETYLYNLLGKEDARTILAMLGGIARALGYKDGRYSMELEDCEND